MAQSKWAKEAGLSSRATNSMSAVPDYIAVQGTKSQGPCIIDSGSWIDLSSFPPKVTGLIDKDGKASSEDEDALPDSEHEFERVYKLIDNTWVAVTDVVEAESSTIHVYGFKKIPPVLKEGKELEMPGDSIRGTVAGRLFVTGEKGAFLQTAGGITPEFRIVDELPHNDIPVRNCLPFFLPSLKKGIYNEFNTGLFWNNKIYILNQKTNKFQRINVLDGSTVDNSEFQFVPVEFNQDPLITQSLATQQANNSRSFFIMDGGLYELRWDSKRSPSLETYDVTKFDEASSSSSSSSSDTKTSKKRKQPETSSKQDKPSKKKKKDKKSGSESAESAASADNDLANTTLHCYRHLPWLDNIHGIADGYDLGLIILEGPEDPEAEDAPFGVGIYQPASLDQPLSSGKYATVPAESVPLTNRDVELITYSEPCKTVTIFVSPTVEGVGEDDDEGSSIPLKGDILGIPKAYLQSLPSRPVRDLYDSNALAEDRAFDKYSSTHLDAYELEPAFAKEGRAAQIYRPKLPSEEFHIIAGWKCPSELLAPDAKELKDLGSLNTYLGAPLWYQTTQDTVGRLVRFGNFLDFFRGRRSSKRLVIQPGDLLSFDEIKWIGVIDFIPPEKRKNQKKSKTEKPQQSAGDKKYAQICQQWNYKAKNDTFLVTSGEILVCDPNEEKNESFELTGGISIPNAATGVWSIKYKETPETQLCDQLMIVHESVAHLTDYTEDWTIPELLTGPSLGDGQLETQIEAVISQFKEEEENGDNDKKKKKNKKRKNPTTDDSSSNDSGKKKKNKKETEENPKQNDNKKLVLKKIPVITFKSNHLKHFLAQCFQILKTQKLTPVLASVVVQYLYAEIIVPGEENEGVGDAHETSSVMNEWKVCHKQPGSESNILGLFDAQYYYDASIAPDPYQGKTGREKYIYQMDSKNPASENLWLEMVNSNLSDDMKPAYATTRFGTLAASNRGAVALLKAVRTDLDQGKHVVEEGKPHTVETIVAAKIFYSDAFDTMDFGDFLGEGGELGEMGEGDGEEGEGEGGEAEGGEEDEE